MRLGTDVSHVLRGRNNSAADLLHRHRRRGSRLLHQDNADDAGVNPGRQRLLEHRTRPMGPEDHGVRQRDDQPDALLSRAVTPSRWQRQREPGLDVAGGSLTAAGRALTTDTISETTGPTGSRSTGRRPGMATSPSTVRRQTPCGIQVGGHLTRHVLDQESTNLDTGDTTTDITQNIPRWLPTSSAWQRHPLRWPLLVCLRVRSDGRSGVHHWLYSGGRQLRWQRRWQRRAEHQVDVAVWV